MLGGSTSAWQVLALDFHDPPRNASHLIDNPSDQSVAETVTVILLEAAQVLSQRS